MVAHILAGGDPDSLIIRQSGTCRSYTSVDQLAKPIDVLDPRTPEIGSGDPSLQFEILLQFVDQTSGLESSTMPESIEHNFLSGLVIHLGPVLPCPPLPHPGHLIPC